ncbi:MAG: dihydroorotate dehydrogenase-like protein [Acidimicrobiia bacterium]
MKPDLTTSYLGLSLAGPVVVSASPIGLDIERLLRFEEAGAAAVVLPSLFEEQIDHESYQVHAVMEHGAESFAEALSYLPEMTSYNTGPERYLGLVHRARRALSVPVIASLNGASPGGWTSYAGKLEEAGASAVELNVYFVAADVNETAQQVEQRYLEIVESVKASVSVPLAVKVGPFFSSMANMAHRLVEAGADGLVLFNRFYQPDIDLDELEVVPNLQLSDQAEMRLTLRWVAILHSRVKASLAATTGVHDGHDVVKLLLAGADVTMMASALLRHGPGRMRECVDTLHDWLAENEYESVEQMKGSMSWQGAPNPSAFERANYMDTLRTFKLPK